MAFTKKHEGTFFNFRPVGPLITQPRSTLVAYGPLLAAGITSLGRRASGTLAPINRSTWESNSVSSTYPRKCGHRSTSSYLGISSFETGITGLASVSCRGMTTFSSRSEICKSLTIKLSTSSLLPMVVNLSFVFLPPIPRRSRRLNTQKVKLEPISKSTYVTMAQGLPLTLIFTGTIGKSVMEPSKDVRPQKCGVLLSSELPWLVLS